MRHQVCSRKRKGTEFKTLRHIDDDDRQSLGKIVRLSEESNTVILSPTRGRPKKDDDPAIKEDDEREADRKRKKHSSSAHMQALELIQRRKAAAEMLRIY